MPTHQKHAQPRILDVSGLAYRGADRCAGGMSLPLRLDLTRLIWRTRFHTPSGIDRVELEYARHFLARGDSQFVIRAGVLGGRLLNSAQVAGLLDWLVQAWDEGGEGSLARSAAMLAGSSKMPAGPALALIPSHQNWHRPTWLRHVKGQGGKLVLFLHDTIPVDHPEYAREGGAARHAQRLDNALELADALLINSVATATALSRYVAPGSIRQRVEVVPLGTLAPVAPDPTFAHPRKPYFVCLGTIEPRKNHLLLLHVWRAMAERHDAEIPHLVIVGRRGWENEQVLDLLERNPAVRCHVSEYNELGDSALASLLDGASALLMASFAEGFGMPVNEALARGVPVIASNLAVFRETAGEIPLYLDSLDGPGWERAVLAYARSGSSERQAQLERLKGWQAPDWFTHFKVVDRLLGELSVTMDQRDCGVAHTRSTSKR